MWPFVSAFYHFDNVFVDYPCCTTYWYFNPFHYRRIFHFVGINQILFIHSLIDEHLGYFYLLTTVNNAAMNSHA